MALLGPRPASSPPELGAPAPTLGLLSVLFILSKSLLQGKAGEQLPETAVFKPLISWTNILPPTVVAQDPQSFFLLLMHQGETWWSKSGTSSRSVSISLEDLNS